MPLLIINLFLPYTVNFEVEASDVVQNGSPVECSVLRNTSQSNVFSHAPLSASPINIPPAGSEDSRSPLSNTDHGLRLETNIIQNAPTPVAPNEPHSPAWGDTEHFIQPHLHALEQLPPASVLQRGLVTERAQQHAVQKWSATNHSRRSSNHERSLRTAKWNVQPAEKGNGGLRNAVYAASQKGGLPQVVWIGTISMPTDSLDEERKAEILEKLDTDFDSLVVYPKDSDFDSHYSHFCKIILWPVLHYQIPDSPKSKAYLEHSWVYYVKINKLFAEKIVKNYKRGDTVWIHDYHLLLVPKMVREKLPEAQIGFFLHVAFPSSEVFRCLAYRQELLEGMLGANLIGFQTQEYCHHFLSTCNRLLRAESFPYGIQLDDRFVNVGTFPIGIDSDLFRARQADPIVYDSLERLEHKYESKKLIVARDKLDIRGIRQKLLAFEYLLRTYPEFRENVVMIQIASSTDIQAEIDAKIPKIVDHINTNYSTLAHQPLIYLKKDLEYRHYVALLEYTDVLMVTNLREGMNLSAHEYILSQDGAYGHKEHGCLILSEFIGNAAVFDEHDFIVNPWDVCQCAEAIRRALIMSEREKQRRWEVLHEAVLVKNANSWIRSFMSSLAQAHDQHSRHHTGSIPRLRVNDLASKYRKSNQRLFILDYEGTLASHGTPLSASYISLQRITDTLTDLLAMQGNTVYVMSGRTMQELDTIFRLIPGLGLIAENGCLIKRPDDQEWICLAPVSETSRWQDSIQKMLQYYQERLEGSSIDVRNCSIFFNTSKAKDQQNVARLIGACTHQLNEVYRNFKVHAVLCDGGLLIESLEFDKRYAAEWIFDGLKDDNNTPDFLMIAGDAREDETVYRWANQLQEREIIPRVCTVSVSSRNTEAMTTLTQGVTGVLSTLQKLASTKAG